MAASSCYDRALGLLSRRSHFRRQLEEKLRARGYAPDEVSETLGRLTDYGYLDDPRVALEYVETRLRRGPIGRRRMRLELEKRGATAAAVEDALESGYAERSDLDTAREAAVRWLRRGGGEIDRLARHLDRLGFTTASVLRVVEDEKARRESR